MIDFPVKLLTVSYMLAAGLALAAWGGGFGTLGSVLLVWLGAPVLVLVIAATPMLAARFARAEHHLPQNLVSEDECRLWDEDLLLDQMVPPARRVSRG